MSEFLGIPRQERLPDRQPLMLPFSFHPCSSAISELHSEAFHLDLRKIRPNISIQESSFLNEWIILTLNLILGLNYVRIQGIDTAVNRISASCYCNSSSHLIWLYQRFIQNRSVKVMTEMKGILGQGFQRSWRGHFLRL
jgi:hypothetical protein